MFGDGMQWLHGLRSSTMTRSIGAVPDANGEACVDGAVVEEEGHSIFQGILILICILHVMYFHFLFFFKSITMIENRE